MTHPVLESTAAALLSLLLCASCAPPEQTVPPNIVMIYVDDLGWRDLGVQGSGYYETPHIDRLAAGGMRFTRAYANAPNCAPSRAALMSGQYAPRTGIYTVGSFHGIRHRCTDAARQQNGQSRDKTADCLVPAPHIGSSYVQYSAPGEYDAPAPF